jgi:hypothetical protein
VRIAACARPIPPSGPSFTTSSGLLGICKTHPRENLRRFARRVLTRALSALSRFAPPGSVYLDHTNEAARQMARRSNAKQSKPLVTVETLCENDGESHQLESVAGLLHADLFTTFLRCHGCYARRSYFDAVAIVAGSVLKKQTHKLATATATSRLVITLTRSRVWCHASAAPARQSAIESAFGVKPRCRARFEVSAQCCVSPVHRVRVASLRHVCTVAASVRVTVTCV